MANRTTDAEVRLVITTDATVDTAQFITTANALTDFVAAEDTSGILNTALLKQIETYLAAHFYGVMDQQYRTKKTGDASATFQGKDGMRLESTDWGQQAIAIDVSGTLASINKGNNKLSLSWLGTIDSAAQDYWDRNE